MYALTVCVWHCEHARFYVDVCMRHTYIFIPSFLHAVTVMSYHQTLTVALSGVMRRMLQLPVPLS